MLLLTIGNRVVLSSLKQKQKQKTKTKERPTKLLLIKKKKIMLKENGKKK